MARASTPTLLPIDTFFKRLSYSPILGNQVQIAELQPATSCSDPMLQYTWQQANGGMPGREEIAQAIAQAEDQIARWLHFPVAPKWIVDEEVIPVRKPAGGASYGRYGRVSGFWSGGCWYEFSVIAEQKHFIQGGIEAWSVIDDGAAVAYTDVDGDGYKELATVVVSTTITDKNEIAVYYPGSDHDPAWEIRPITVTFAGGVATITFERQQAVLRNMLESLAAQAVDGLDDANFLTTVDVYRHYNDPSTMAIVEWSGGICDESACIVSAQAACVSPHNSRNSIIGVHAADWDADAAEWTHICPTWWAEPTRVRLNYRAGFRSKSVQRPMWEMDFQLEQAVTFLALSLMDREWLACEPMHNLQARWRTDLAQRNSTQAQSTSFQLSRAKLDNPLGTTRAAVFAWDVITRLAVGEAVTGS